MAENLCGASTRYWTWSEHLMSIWCFILNFNTYCYTNLLLNCSLMRIKGIQQILASGCNIRKWKKWRGLVAMTHTVCRYVWLWARSCTSLSSPPEVAVAISCEYTADFFPTNLATWSLFQELGDLERLAERFHWQIFFLFFISFCWNETYSNAGLDLTQELLE